MVPLAVTLLKRAAGQPYLPLIPMRAAQLASNTQACPRHPLHMNTLWLEWEWSQAPSSCHVGGCLVRGRSPEMSWVPPGGPSSPRQRLLHPRPSSRPPAPSLRPSLLTCDKQYVFVCISEVFSVMPEVRTH